MKNLDGSERRQVVGEYFAPAGLYEYTKSLPFLGTVESNVETLVAGEWTEIVIVYKVGASGLADGAWIKGTFKFYSVSLFLSLNFQSLIDLGFQRIGPFSKHQTPPQITMSAPSILQTRSYRDKHRLPFNHYVSGSIKRGTKDHFKKRLLSTYRMGI